MAAKRRRWRLNLTPRQLRRERDAAKKRIRAAEQKARDIYASPDYYGGKQIFYKEGDPRPRNKYGHVIAALMPEQKFAKLPGGRARRLAAWSLRSNNVDRDKRSGRFIKRRSR